MITRSTKEWLDILDTMPVEGPGIRGMDFLTSSDTDWKRYKRFFSILDSVNILDIGCGHGRMALNFVNTNTHYIGIDIIPEVIDWATAAFTPWKNICFYHHPVANSMYRPSGLDPLKFNTMFSDKTMYGILALSLFTHLESLDVVKHYLTELRRVIRDDGTLAVTFFLAPPNDCSGIAQRSVFHSYDIKNLFADLKFKVHASWGGFTKEWHDQKVYILKPV
jgi:SAM-dependent methyltransferase